MKTEIHEIKVNGNVYVPKDSVQPLEPAEKVDGLEYCIFRTYSAGVHAGYLKEREGKEAVVLHARRLYYWDGASSLSELAMKGVSKPSNCKFPCEVPKIFLTEVIEVIPATKKAQESINSVAEWTSHEE